jgi:aspartyl/asparaginyl beta-hydroxylase (cupin superfamily)
VLSSNETFPELLESSHRQSSALYLTPIFQLQLHYIKVRGFHTVMLEINLTPLHLHNPHTLSAPFQQPNDSYKDTKRLRWSRGSVLAFGTQVRGFKPGFFRAKKSSARLPSEGK